MRRRFFLLLALLSFLLVPGTANAQDTRHFDVLITGGQVLDGSGNPWFRADIGITGDRIAAVGLLANATADRVIDATGKTVSPGFIDIHSHADDTGDGPQTIRNDDIRRKSAPNIVSQGVTTVVINHDGRSQWPIAEQRSILESQGVGPNVMLMVGHGTIRRLAMGDDFRRPATPEEVERMRELLRQGMAEGAVGMSAGLEYVPGRWSTTEEVATVAAELLPRDGVYISHQRSEGPDPMWFWPSQHEPGPPTLMDAVMETIEIGRRSGARVVASHIKAKGAHFWGAAHTAIQLIERARAEGVRVYADQYPYATSGSDGNTRLIPRWAFGERDDERSYTARLQDTMADPDLAADVRRDISHEIRRRGGADRVVIFEYPNEDYVGKSLAEVAEEREVDAVRMAVLLQMEGDPERPGGGRLRGFSMSEDDVDAYARQDWVVTASDGGIAVPEDGSVHARFYGTFPRKLRHFALDRDVISVEHAVRSMTSLPAQVMGLDDRGTIREGNYADIVVFRMDEIRDEATFFAPHQHAGGIDYVLVNGEFVLDEGELTQGLPGRVLAN